jgi:hypothetical protein
VALELEVAPCRAGLQLVRSGESNRDRNIARSLSTSTSPTTILLFVTYFSKEHGDFLRYVGWLCHLHHGRQLPVDTNTNTCTVMALVSHYANNVIGVVVGCCRVVFLALACLPDDYKYNAVKIYL